MGSLGQSVLQDLKRRLTSPVRQTALPPLQMSHITQIVTQFGTILYPGMKAYQWLDPMSK
jgi:hypothetical protein